VEQVGIKHISSVIGLKLVEEEPEKQNVLHFSN